MKVAILSESPADEAAIRIFVETLIGTQITPVMHAGLRVRGWPSVRHVFPAVIKQLHYRTDAEALVLVADSNESPVHTKAHEEPGREESVNVKQTCRLCQLRRIRQEVLGQLKNRPGGLPPLKIALGVAVPTIEAWLLCGVDPRVGEAGWNTGLQYGNLPYSKVELKRRLYGTDRPALDLEIVRMRESAERLAADLAALEQAFPSGFGAFARELRGWAGTSPNLSG